jgi:hypothetical protein
MKEAINNYPVPKEITVPEIGDGSFMVPEYSKIVVENDGWSSHNDSWSSSMSLLQQSMTAKYAELAKHPPIVIEIENKSDKEINDVNVFTSNNPDLQFKSLMPDMDYLQILESIKVPKIIGRLLFISTSAGQIEQVISVTVTKDDGSKTVHYIIPTIDPYPQQTDRIIDDFEWILNELTEVSIHTILPNSKMTLRLYTMTSFSNVANSRPHYME